MKEDISIRTATPAERARVVDTIVLGFASDPLCRWIWPEPRAYLAAFDRMTKAMAGRAFDQGTAFVTGGYEGAALWLPPGIEADENTLALIVAETVTPDRLEAIGALMEAMEEAHPEGDIWYLPLIACDPVHVGKGIGGALMAHALERIDADGRPAYLESSNPRNVSLYLRHGFEVIGEIKVGSAPVMTPMWRPAQSRSALP